MADLTLKCVIQPAESSSPVGWKYEIFIEGEEAPYSIGYYFGTRAEAEAIALQTQQRFLDEWKANNQSAAARPRKRRAMSRSRLW